MRVSRIFLSLFLVTTCFGQLGNVNLKPLLGMQFVNRTHRLGRGLVAYLPFNERSGPTVFDLSGNGLTGTFGGNVVWVPGEFGSAVNFPGGGADVIDFGDMSSLFSTEATLVMWLKCDKNIPLTGGQTGLLYLNTTTADAHYPYTSGIIYLPTFRDNRLTVGDVGIDKSQWHQLAITSKPGANNWKFFQNAVEYYNATGENTISIDTTSKFGQSEGDYRFNGQISHIYLYNRALSAGEIAELYAKPFVLFQKDNTALIASVEAPPAPGGQFIMIQMSMIPLFLIFTLVCFIRGKES